MPKDYEEELVSDPDVVDIDRRVRAFETTVEHLNAEVRRLNKQRDDLLLAKRPASFVPVLLEAGFEEELRKAVEWVKTCEQPAGAAINHFGINRQFGSVGVNLGHRRVTLSLPDVWGQAKSGRIYQWTDEETAAVKEVMNRVVPVKESWRGDNWLSIILDFEPGSGFLLLMENYHKDPFSTSQAKHYGLAVLPEGWE